MTSPIVRTLFASTLAAVFLAATPGSQAPAGPRRSQPATLASQLTSARGADGSYISWKEHLIDSGSPGVELEGSDGLVIGDLDKDGYLDVVSVHEHDTVVRRR